MTEKIFPVRVPVWRPPMGPQWSPKVEVLERPVHHSYIDVSRRQDSGPIITRDGPNRTETLYCVEQNVKNLLDYC